MYNNYTGSVHYFVCLNKKRIKTFLPEWIVPILLILNDLTMEYRKTTRVIYPLRQNVLLSEFIELPCQSPNLGNMGKYTPTRASSLQTFPVLGQLYWAIQENIHLYYDFSRDER